MDGLTNIADPTSGLGPGRNVGLIPGSKGDFGVKGVGVQDVIQGLILGGMGGVVRKSVHLAG
jgi:hypothetical protein